MRKKNDIKFNISVRSAAVLAVGLVFVEFVILIICLISSNVDKKTEEIVKKDTGDIVVISGIDNSIRGDSSYVHRVTDVFGEGKDKEAPVSTPIPEETILPTSTPEPTPEPVFGKIKYYQFALKKNSYSSSEYKGDGVVLSGISSDETGSMSLIVSTDKGEISYGNLFIQNPYSAEGINLKEILKTPLVIRKAALAGNPSILMYYTHTSESYSTSENDRDLKKVKSLANYDFSRNVVGAGTRVSSKLAENGVLVINDTQINDKEYDLSYQKSNELVRLQSEKYPSIDLAIDVHINSLEYPTGKRYAPVKSFGGVDYAKILFVVSSCDDAKTRDENIRLCMVLIEKMEAKVPGITLGISLRNDIKYNPQYTNKSILVEIGFDGNFAKDAYFTADLLGGVLGEIYG